MFTSILKFLSAQEEKSAYKIIADQLQSNYNKDDYNGIFNMFSPDMKDALPVDKTKEFFSQLKADAGKIVKKEFINYQETFAVYKATFEKTVFSLNISVDNKSQIDGLFIKPFEPGNLPKIDRNKTKLLLPFKGAWTVYWGGDTQELNYHIINKAQKNAFDFIITDKSGKSFKTDGSTNSDYYAFGKEIFAPCDGTVVSVLNGVRDNKPGEMNPRNVTGNSVVLKTVNNEYILFAHFKYGSIKVKKGQVVKQRQLLGLCGNSGNSSEAHLHFHIQNAPAMDIATGVKCYFDKLLVNGSIKKDYSPVKGDIVENAR